jgi:hypothetical protein
MARDTSMKTSSADAPAFPPPRDPLPLRPSSPCPVNGAEIRELSWPCPRSSRYGQLTTQMDPPYGPTLKLATVLVKVLDIELRRSKSHGLRTLQIGS